VVIGRPSIVWKGAATGNYTPGREFPISQISEHHVVGDAASAYNRALTPGSGFSCGYTIAADGTIYQCVADSNRAWCDNHWPSNQITISIEHAGGGGGVPYTDAMYSASQQLHAWLIQQYGIESFRRHREIVAGIPSKATACCGELDLGRILSGAYALLEGEPMSKVDKGIARIAAYYIGGNNGYDGKPNALNGERDAELATTHVQRETNTDIYDWHNGDEAKQWREVRLPKLYKDASRSQELEQQNKELKTQISMQSEDTKFLNMFGEALAFFIKRFGMKKT
jgi:hypothetical protein